MPEDHDGPPAAYVLADLQNRMVKAAVEIDKLCDRAAFLHNTTEFSRLDGKRQGVRLCLSYLDEVVRV
jgi:hypothetical protein